MSVFPEALAQAKPTHPWLREIRVAFVPGPMTPLMAEVADELLRSLRLLGYQVCTLPDDRTDVILTTARFGESVAWREAMLFTGRRRFSLRHTPAVYTLTDARLARFHDLLRHFEAVLSNEPPDPGDYAFPGLAPGAYRVLCEQGRRGGPILALERLVQAQTKSIRVILVVGDDRPLVAYHFDLAGAHPYSEARDAESFYQDIALRVVTAASTSEVTEHESVGEPISRALWESLSTPHAMRVAGRQLGERHFFTEMVRIPDLVQVPAVGEAVASQYSEGCFATWEPALNALIATVTGSIRPVDKGNITEGDLAVIVGVRSDGRGALVRHVQGKRNDPPSSEAVEMMVMDGELPWVALRTASGMRTRVPVVRSKLHGHRGIGAYDPRRVEYVPLDPPYYHYLVSCATEAQTWAIQKAFSRSEALQNPEDPRQAVFTVLPGHGAVVVEKWVPGTTPFQVLLEYIDADALRVDNCIPQGPMEYVPGPAGRMVMRTVEDAVSSILSEWNTWS